MIKRKRQPRPGKGGFEERDNTMNNEEKVIEQEQAQETENNEIDVAALQEELAKAKAQSE